MRDQNLAKCGPRSNFYWSTVSCHKINDMWLPALSNNCNFFIEIGFIKQKSNDTRLLDLQILKGQMRRTESFDLVNKTTRLLNERTICVLFFFTWVIFGSLQWAFNRESFQIWYWQKVLYRKTSLLFLLKYTIKFTLIFDKKFV